MVRLPPIVVGVLFAIVLGVASYWLAWRFDAPRAVIILLPVCALIGGFVAARWSDRPPRVPGLEVGLLLFAAQAGMSLGLEQRLFVFADPGLALTQGIAAIAGGMMGVLLARRASQTTHAPKPEYRPL